MNYYPAMLDLRGRKAVVIGGGKVAARKIRELLHCDADVVAVAPSFDRAIARLAIDPRGRPAAGHRRIDLKTRAYRRGDLSGAAIAVIATSDARVQERAWAEADRLGILVNTVDERNRCTFITPAVVRRSPLLIAISTNGTNPGIARHLRERLARQFDARFGALLRIAARQRRRMRAAGVSYADRTAFAADVLDSRAGVAIKRGRASAARAIVERLAARYPAAPRPSDAPVAEPGAR